MADRTPIEWTDATWNPVTGCAVVSPGCAHCYAMVLAGGRLRHHPSRAGLTDMTKAGPVWNGQVRLNAAELVKPLRWARSRRIFVCAHGDLFHEAVPFAWVDQVFAAMLLAPRHTYQVLTKRPERMAAYLDQLHGWRRPLGDAAELIAGARHRAGLLRGLEAGLPNVWCGISAEDQARFDARWPHLRDARCAVRFLSAEPLLGPIEILPGLDWVIVGGESGPRARPMHGDWARRIRDDCAATGAAFFFKQWGEWCPWGEAMADGAINLTKAGGDLHYFKGGGIASRVGKTRAGRLLDGVPHDVFPGSPAPRARVA
jgi:protein gp37